MVEKSNKKTRSLEWGSSKRPEINLQPNVPHASQGSDGDIQVRNTSMGARIFAKLGGSWLSNVLHGNILDNPDVFMPKVWFNRGLSPAADDDKYIYLPNDINNSNILAINFGISIGADIRTYFWLGDSGTSTAYDMFVHYNTPLNRITIENRDSSATEVANKDYTLAIFFK